MTLPEAVLYPVNINELTVIDDGGDTLKVKLKDKAKPKRIPLLETVIDNLEDFHIFQKNMKRNQFEHDPHQWPRLTTRFKNKWLYPKMMSQQEIHYFTSLR